MSKYQLYKLSAKFFIDYPNHEFPELLSKPDRPHYCLLIDTHCDYYICIPFRSNIEHDNAFKFKNTARSNRSQSGLDYSKIVIIKDLDYLNDENVVIDKDEYKIAIKNLQKIELQVLKYVETYIKHVTNICPLNKKEYNRKYKFSTLPYFHDILNLPIKTQDLLTITQLLKK